jgi:nicotinamidase-related amidase
MQPATTSSPTKRALLLIDFQRDFIESTGKMPVAMNQVASVLGAAAEAIADAKRSGQFILAIGNEFRSKDFLTNLLRRHASIAGSDGAKWTEKLPIDGAVYFAKWSASAFVNPELEKWLKANSVTELVLTGLQARACVAATAKDALAKGYAVQVLANAVACVSDASRARALAKLERKGVIVLRDPTSV